MPGTIKFQSSIDGAKFATFIDETVENAVQGMRERGDELAEKIIDRLKEVDGKHMVESASV